jgi:hypothetical protein
MRKITYYDYELEENRTISLETKRIVCPECDGEGRRTNPAIDGNGLSNEDLSDRDFLDDYMSGRYDVQCPTCRGRNIYDEIIENWDNPEFVAYVKSMEIDAQYDDIEAAERAMGA